MKAWKKNERRGRWFLGGVIPDGRRNALPVNGRLLAGLLRYRFRGRTYLAVQTRTKSYSRAERLGRRARRLSKRRDILDGARPEAAGWESLRVQSDYLPPLSQLPASRTASIAIMEAHAAKLGFDCPQTHQCAVQDQVSRHPYTSTRYVLLHLT